jgi:c-di-GMP-binding flagellar brake protein YcgR
MVFESTGHQPEKAEKSGKTLRKRLVEPSLSGFLVVSPQGSAFLLGFDDTCSYP